MNRGITPDQLQLVTKEDMLAIIRELDGLVEQLKLEIRLLKKEAKESYR